MTPQEMKELRERLEKLDSEQKKRTADAAPDMMRLIRAQEAEIARLREELAKRVKVLPYSAVIGSAGEQTPIRVVQVRNFREAREISQSPNPLYVDGLGDLSQIKGLELSKGSAPIYVSNRVDVSKLMRAALLCYRPSTTGKKDQNQ